MVQCNRAVECCWGVWARAHASLMGSRPIGACQKPHNRTNPTSNLPTRNGHNFSNCWPCHTLILLLWSLWHGQWKWGTVHFLAPSGALYVMMRYCQSAALQLRTTRTTTKKCRKWWQCMQVAMDKKGHNTQLNASIFIRWRSVPKSPDALVSDGGFLLWSQNRTVKISPYMFEFYANLKLVGRFVDCFHVLTIVYRL